MKNKIVYIIESFNIGGREKVVLDLCNKVNKDVFDVTLIILSNDRLSFVEALDKSIKIYALNINQKQLRSFKFFPLSLNKLINILKELKPHIIHSHVFYMHLLLISLAILISNENVLHFRTVHTSGLFYENQKTLIDKFRLYIEKIAIKINKTYLIGVSQAVHKNNIKYFKKYSMSLKLIYNGVDLDKFKKSNYCLTKNNFGYEKSDIVVSYVARLDSGKNHLFLIEIWREVQNYIHNAKLCFIGDGFLREELINAVVERNLENTIKFLGSASNVFELLSISDLAVFPSSFEGFSLVMLEKFAMSLPVIASDIAAFREIGNNGKNCFLVSLEDRDLYVKKIIELCENDKLRSVMAANARITAIKFNINKCITFHEEYYLQSLKC